MALERHDDQSSDRLTASSHPNPLARRTTRRAGAPARPSVAKSTTLSTTTGSIPVAPRRSRGRNVLSVTVMTLAVGLVATVSIPSYAFDPVANANPQFARTDIQALTYDEAQTVDVAATAAQTTVSRDAYTATTPEELRAAAEAKAAEEAAAAAAAARATTSASYASYSGPSAQDYLANPPYPNFSLSQVYQVGLQYQGVPYVYGGSNPSGFDCSGFVMFVYAQFGINLAHSVRSQAASGTVIDPASAQPGDLVIFSDGSHDGIYAGNGNVLHAPYEGQSVRVQPIWASHYFVRLGI